MNEKPMRAERLGRRAEKMKMKYPKGGNEMIKEDANRNADLDNPCLFLRFYC